MYVSQPSLSIFRLRSGKKLGFKIFVGPVLGLFWPVGEWNFMKKRRTWSKGLIFFQNQYASPKKKKEFSISSQHYDFLPPLMTEFSILSENKNFRIFESTTVQILDEAQGIVSWGLFISTVKIPRGIMQRVDKLGLEVVDLIPLFRLIFTFAKDILWLRRKNWLWKI